MSTQKLIRANLVNIAEKQIYPVKILLENNKIAKIERTNEKYEQFILPGFIDSHIHIESSMLTPSEFARIAVLHGTVATVSDPHEIGNVLGIEGVNFMIENGNKVPFKFYFGAPSCVPATDFETAGATITAKDIETLFQNPQIKYLTEMMNYPGVLFDDPVVLEKIAIAKKYNRPIDGHAPGLRGEQAKKYISAGISTDHECFTAGEALDKLKLGMKILIREGSAAKNFEALIDLLPDYPKEIMLCSDDKHPDDLVEGHMNLLVKRALKRGIDLFDILQAVCINPIEHYNLDVGQLREGDPADFILVDNLTDFNVLETYIDGEMLAQNGNSFIRRVKCDIINNFNTDSKTVNQFAIEAKTNQIRVIEALDGELVTKQIIAEAKIENNNVVSDVENDVLKFTVVNRYQNTEPALAFIKNFGIKEGAIASSVGHDSHNILAVGTSDEYICRAVNLLIQNKGGISAVSATDEKALPLPIAGIMSPADGYKVGKYYAELDKMAKQMGSQLKAPYMTLSFMALLVIPSAKLSDLGLFDGDKFEFMDLFVK